MRSSPQLRILPMQCNDPKFEFNLRISVFVVSTEPVDTPSSYVAPHPHTPALSVGVAVPELWIYKQLKDRWYQAFYSDTQY